MSAERIYLNCPFEEKDACKALGGRWDGDARKWYITDDMTLNINSIYTDEKIWIQRVDWEWMSKEIVFERECIKLPAAVDLF